MRDMEVVGLLVTVPRELRRRLKVAAYERDMTLNGFVLAALELLAARPDTLAVADVES